MKIAIGADHAGFVVKESLRKKLAAEGNEVVDFGTNSTESIDYPDFAALVGREVGEGRADRGILVCGTGVGMAMAANKIHGVRAAPLWSEAEAQLAREHNDANVAAFGARLIDEATAEKLTDIFLNTEFAGGRHARRIAKIAQLENS
jgi:ribose 5-phosphate isomerase B